MNRHRLVRILALCMILVAPLRTSAWTLPSPMFNSPQTQQTEPTPDNKKKDKKNAAAPGAQTTAGPPASTQPTAQPQSAPKPLFGGQVNLKSSRQSKDTATLGFNGLDPNGQVQKAFLSAAPTSADLAKAQQLTRTDVNPAELTAFLQEGGLKTTGGQQ